MIINRYLFKEIWYALIGVFIVLLFIVVTERFVRYLGDVAAGSLPVDVVFTLLGFKILNYIALLLSVAFYLALLLALTRLYKDNEMAALASCGVGLGQLLWPITVFAVVVALVVAAFSLYISPWAAGYGNQLREKAESIADVSALAAGRFLESAEGNWVIYADGYSEQERAMSDVFIQARNQGSIDVFSAQRALVQYDEATGDRLLVMFNGYRYQGMPGSADYRILKYEKQIARLRVQPVAIGSKREEIATATLVHSQHPREVAELQWRVSLPLTVPVMALLVVMLSPRTPGRGRSPQVLSAILAYVIYHNLLGVARSWVGKAMLPPALGLWWVHALILATIAVLWLRRSGIRWQLDRYRYRSR